MAVTRRGRRLIAALILITAVIVIGQVVRRNSAAPVAKRTATGTSATIGSVKWLVFGTFKTQELATAKGPLRAKSWFVVVDLSLTNTAGKTVKLDPSAVVVVDSQNRVYPADKTASDTRAVIYNGIPISSLFDANLPPKKPTRVGAVFPVGPSASRLKLKVKGEKVGDEQDLLIDIGF